MHATKVKRKIIHPLDQTSKGILLVAIHTFWGHDSVFFVVIVDIGRLGLIDLHGRILLCLGNDQILLVPLQSTLNTHTNEKKKIKILVLFSFLIMQFGRAGEWLSGFFFLGTN